MAYATRTTPVDRINAALKSDVVDALRPLVPDLAPYSNEEAVNVILSSPEMAQRSFEAFRAHPDAFAEMLRGPENQPIANDDEPLSCGRTLAQVVALVVQAVAKRYFRAKLSLRRRKVQAAKPTPVQRLMRLLTRAQPPAPPPRPVPGQADRLFVAMRDHLLFEWQLRLIPHYAGLPVPVVQALGARLLEFREIEDIQQMVRTGQPLTEPTIREPEISHPFDAEPEIVPLALPAGFTPERFVSAVLEMVAPPVARWLAREMQLNPRQLTLMLIRAYEVLPVADFQRFGASAPAASEARQFLDAARAAGFGADTSPAVTEEFARLYQTGTESPV